MTKIILLIASACFIYAADYFPLKAGTYWNYTLHYSYSDMGGACIGFNGNYRKEVYRIQSDSVVIRSFITNGTGCTCDSSSCGTSTSSPISVDTSYCLYIKNDSFWISQNHWEGLGDIDRFNLNWQPLNTQYQDNNGYGHCIISGPDYTLNGKNIQTMYVDDVCTSGDVHQYRYGQGVGLIQNRNQNLYGYAQTWDIQLDLESTNLVSLSQERTFNFSKDTIFTDDGYNERSDSVILINTSTDSLVFDSVNFNFDSTKYKVWQMAFYVGNGYNEFGASYDYYWNILTQMDNATILAVAPMQRLLMREFRLGDCVYHCFLDKKSIAFSGEEVPDTISVTLIFFSKGMSDTLTVRSPYHWGWGSVDKTNSNLYMGNLLMAPNPFNPTNEIHFTNKAKKADVAIFDIHGKRVQQWNNVTGTRIAWDAIGMASGVYVVKIANGGKVLTKALVLQR